MSQTVILTSSLLSAFLTTGDLSETFGPYILLLATLDGIAIAFLTPGRLAFLGDLTAGEHLTRATMNLSFLVVTAFGSSSFVAGFIKQYSDWKTLYLAIEAVQLIALTRLILLKAPETVATNPPDRKNERRSFFSELRFMRAGLRFSFTNGELLLLNLWTALGFFSVGPALVALPEFFRNNLQLDELQRGLLLFLLAPGLMGGAILARYLPQRVRPQRVIPAAIFLMGLHTVLIAECSQAISAGLTLFSLGVCGGVMSALIPAELQARTPNEYRGRVAAVYSILAQLAPALAGLFCGYVAETWGMGQAIRMAGGVVVFGLFACIGVKIFVK